MNFLNGLQIIWIDGRWVYKDTLKPTAESKKAEVMRRLRTNEALEEDLMIANKKIDELQLKLILIMAAVADSLSRLEDSEEPFYNGIKTLKGLIKNNS